MEIMQVKKYGRDQQGDLFAVLICKYILNEIVNYLLFYKCCEIFMCLKDISNA